jgi:serine/threonine protein kinase
MELKNNVEEILIQNELYIVKKATTKEKQILLEDEINNLKKLQKVSPFLGIGIISYKESIVSQTETILVTKKILGFLGHTTLRSLLFSNIFVHDLWFREILFQVIYTIGSLQLFFNGFRHNDLKADNILLQLQPVSNYKKLYTWPPKPLSLKHQNQSNKSCTFKLNTGIETFLIDFELSTSLPYTKIENNNNFDSTYLTSRSIECADKIFGLSFDRCDLFDIHLLFSELRLFAPLKSWGPSFLLFCKDFFDDSMFTKVHSTRQFRMNLKTQKDCMTERWTKYDHFISRVLHHEYFNHLKII